MSTSRLPVVYLPHGGGPWPFVDLAMFARDEVEALAGYLRALPGELPASPRALLVVSAHWEEPVATVMTAERPPLFFDYYGFPPESYELAWPAPGDPQLAARTRALLAAAGFATAADPKRGFDHGTFIPLKVAFPSAEIPTVQLSMLRGLDPKRHLALGRALSPLRDEGVLIVGSGMSYHDLPTLMTRRGRAPSAPFDAWLRAAATALLAAWEQAPNARRAHPREDHLLPLMVAAGAAGDDAGRIAHRGLFGDAWIAAVHFG
jgi:aromatic ring-opening dioxygenase catalytic subunit (LigB family)